MENFLWYSYFGITKDSASTNQNRALQKCIDRAYRDFNRTLNFCYSTKEIALANEKKPYERTEYESKAAAFPEKKSDWKKGTVEILTESIDTILHDTSKAYTYSCWHKKVCDDLVKLSIKSHAFADNGFTYGHAQKWVNMTMKYILLMGLWDTELAHIKPYLHIPIDNYILNVLENPSQYPSHKLLKTNEGLAYCIHKNDGTNKLYSIQYTKNGSRYELVKARTRGILRTTWSGIESYELYDTIRKGIENVINLDGKTPIEWEYYAWLAAADGVAEFEYDAHYRDEQENA